ncbi:MAG: M1 family metallopeptidase [Novosphingobium sp.]|nr:M1 family metallopeptidase [Novosphingobium sp.]
MRPVSLTAIGLSLALALAVPATGQTASASQPVVEQALAVPLGELADAVAPAAYRLDFTIDPAQEQFSGRTEIDVTLKGQPLASFYLHGRNLSVGKVMARVDGREVAGRWTQVDDSGVARLDFEKPLPAGRLVTLAFDYRGTMNDGPFGLFRANVAGQWYGWSQFQSIDARAAFPSFDQPSFKTPFTLTVRTPPGLTAVGNAPETGVTREGGLDVHRFAPTLPLPTYLVAVMVGPFAHVADAVPPTPQREKPLPLRIVSTAQNAGKLDFALEGSKDIVKLLESYFADAFPYPKLDQITSPLMPGAMENAGADLYGDGIIVMGADAPVVDRRRFGMVVAHELAHQWFGDLVTPRWWDDIWLNESFANWMGYRIGGEWKPDLKIGTGGLAEGFAAMRIDELAAGRPIRQRIETNSQIDAAFDAITYGKGGQVVAMIAAFMGDEKFRDGVRRYMAAHRNGNATSTDFFVAMAEAASDPRIVPAMRSFTDQQGVPLVTFSRDGTGWRWRAAQGRYAPLGQTVPPQRWGIPLCVRSGAERQCTLLADDTTAVAIADAGALVPNAGGTGYYRFELPDAEWDALIAQALTLDAGEALATADSLGASVRAGRASVTRLAALARVLVRHTDSHAADAATDELVALAGMGMLDSAGRKGWRRFLTATYRPLLERHGFDPRAGAYVGEDPDVTQRRIQIVSLLASPAADKAVRKRLEQAVAAWLTGDEQALDPMWFSKGFDAWIARHGLKGGKELMDRALASSDPAFRPRALAAISGSGWAPIARWLLAGVGDPRLRPDEERGFLKGVLSSRSTARIGYDWMKGNLDTLLSGAGGIFYTANMPQWLGRFCSVDMANEFARDLGPRFAGKSGELELARVIDRVRNCGVLKEQRGTRISADFARLK